MFRIGLGQDSHRIKLKAQSAKLKTDKNLTLGGIEVSKDYYAEANSDGDVILHSLCNALSSAIGGDSLGTWADQMCLAKGITDSREFVKAVMLKVKKNGWQVVNVVIAIEAGKPRIPLAAFQKMKQQIAKLLEIEIDCVGITITSGEKLTPFGKGEAIQVFSTALLQK
jgi:2-C-methyl-D-erythritol 2,4-cyclodiphosphate synthase